MMVFHVENGPLGPFFCHDDLGHLRADHGYRWHRAKVRHQRGAERRTGGPYIPSLDCLRPK